jgi:hypothetical protein
MADFHTKYVDRGNGRSLWLFSESARDYELLDSLPAVPCADAHMRWHPLLREWGVMLVPGRGVPFYRVPPIVRFVRQPKAASSPICPRPIMRLRFSATVFRLCRARQARRRAWR